MYSHLEGKEIELLRFSKRGLVVGCDKDIGITIVNAADHDDYIMCLVGPSSPLWEGKAAQDKYEELFNIIVEQLENGVYDFMIINSIVAGGSKEGPTAKSCAFGQ